MGTLLSVIDQNFPPKAKWGVNDIPDLSSKTMIVTGASSGLGLETAKALLAHNAKVYIACRDPEKAGRVGKELEDETGRAPIFLELDLASLDSVKKAAQEFKSKEDSLHVLFNNAGVMAPPIKELTREGYDLQFGTNVLGHFYFTKLLLPELRAGAQTSSDKVARVISTSSQSHILSKLNYETFTDTPLRMKLGSDGLYNQSKFGTIVFASELARRHGEDGLMSVALHPGSLTTDLGRHISPFIRRIIVRSLPHELICHLLMFGQHALSHSPPEGALTPLYGGTAPEAASLNGQYLIPWARIGKPAMGTLDPEEGKKLWQWLEDQISKYEEGCTPPSS